MPQYIDSIDWEPTDDLVLEPSALKVATSNYNCCVTAGPGAGKTELLAQHANYLLQTGTSAVPRKILALSYKRDAANNIAARVRKRAHKDFSSRFVSLTFDSFAKSLVDHFLFAIPPQYRPAADYLIFSNIVDAYKHFDLGKVDKRVKANLEYHFVSNISALPIIDASPAQGRVEFVWQIMLKGDKEGPSYLTFPMITVLADYMLKCNPQINRALAATYSHVFLDEFQDTTKAQYSLIKTCFSGQKDVILTAVGDNKQRIMIWAGADKKIFDKFRADFAATEEQLSKNHRSAPRLLEIQKVLAKKLSGVDYEASPNEKWKIDDGIGEVWLFEDFLHESDQLCKEIKGWLTQENLVPRDICVLVRQHPEGYGEHLIKALREKEGIVARNETDFQDLLSEECNKIVLNFVKVVSARKAPEAYLDILEMLYLLRGIDTNSRESEELWSIESDLQSFLHRQKLALMTVNSNHTLEQWCWEILNFLNLAVFQNMFPQYKRGEYLHQQMHKLGSFLWQVYCDCATWDNAVEILHGNNSIPLMTIHKSKGLEYDTVIFLGLEDGAFWKFQDQEDEETCAFFVALSRAKRRVIFTFSGQRNTGWNNAVVPQNKTKIRNFYKMLSESGVVEVKDFTNHT